MYSERELFEPSQSQGKCTTNVNPRHRIKEYQRESDVTLRDAVIYSAVLRLRRKHHRDHLALYLNQGRPVETNAKYNEVDNKASW